LDDQKRKISTAVGNRIKYFRRLRSLSQEELALQSNLNPAYFGQVERGEKCPTIDTLCKIAGALEVSPGELLQSTDRPNCLSAYSSRAAEMLSRVPEAKLDQVLRIMEDVTALF
jgi:transcriptional regulator with XRE-family HTH domain